MRRRYRSSSSAAAAAPVGPSQHLRELLRVVFEDLACVDELFHRNSGLRGKERKMMMMMMMREKEMRHADRSRCAGPFESEKENIFSSSLPLPTRTVCLSAGGFPSYVCDSLALSSATESSARAVSTKSGAQLLAGFLTESERSDDADDDVVDGEEEGGAVGAEGGSAAASSRGRGGTPPPSSSAIERKKGKRERSFFALLQQRSKSEKMKSDFPVFLFLFLFDLISSLRLLRPVPTFPRSAAAALVFHIPAPRVRFLFFNNSHI